MASQLFTSVPCWARTAFTALKPFTQTGHYSAKRLFFFAKTPVGAVLKDLVNVETKQMNKTFLEIGLYDERTGKRAKTQGSNIFSISRPENEFRLEKK